MSHSLDKLRNAFGDQLFVRSGRSISPTERALALREPVQEVLDKLQALTYQREFDPSVEPMNFKIAANDYPRDLIFPDLLHKIKSSNINVRFNFPFSGIPSAKMLRENKCDFIITPFLPDGPDIYQTRLFDDELVCFYDKDFREAPKSKSDFFNSEFIEVRFHDNQSDIESLSTTTDIKLPEATVSVPSFNAISPFIKNTSMLCVAISKMQQSCMDGLAITPLPFKTKKIVVYLSWHQRNHSNPAHKWLRNEIKSMI